MKPEQLNTAEPFDSPFAINPQVLGRIQEDMEHHGYDASQPIVMWAEQGVVVDGHTRLAAAKNLGLEEVPVYEKSFADEDAALAHAIGNQRNRRNLTEEEILRCIEALDRRKQRGGDRGNQYTGKKVAKAPNGAIGKSAQETAKMVGVSPRKVERTRTVLKHADPEVVEAVKAGEMSIHRAYQVTRGTHRGQRMKEAGKPVFNRPNENIEWASWTWNPVTGCRHGCPYCYGPDIAARFYGENGFEPKFHPERLSAPASTKPPKPGDPIGEGNVLVCSLGDLFGDWVPQDWIDAVMEAVWAVSQWNFLFLTKNPARLVGIDWPPNAWVGTTVDSQARVKPAEESFRRIKATVKFLSCEPLLEQLTFKNLGVFDWIIIGGQSKTNYELAKQPQWEWVESLFYQARKAGLQIYFKPNLTVRPREYPPMVGGCETGGAIKDQGKGEPAGLKADPHQSN
jgi:protein gp37